MITGWLNEWEKGSVKVHAFDSNNWFGSRHPWYVSVYWDGHFVDGGYADTEAQAMRNILKEEVFWRLWSPVQTYFYSLGPGERSTIEARIRELLHATISELEAEFLS